MIKNEFLKKMLKGSIFKVISNVNKLVKKNDEIILLHMGNKALGFNLEPLYKYLIDNRYNEKCKIVCSVENKKYFRECPNNVSYVDHKKAIVCFLKSKHVFYTAGQLPIKPSKEQIVIHMNHGITDYKTMGALTKIGNGDEFFFTYMIASSPIYVPIIAKEYLCTEDNIKICNEPMIERILNPIDSYDFSEYKKVLLWVPTFRQSDYLGYDDSANEELLPMFSEESYEYLNGILSEKNILFLVKIHPSQSTKNYRKTLFSNLKIYSHEDFEKLGMNLYDLMSQVDGLIGDYSSASLQFLLTDKPLAYIIPDFEEYKEKRGFVFENPKEYMPGHIITTRREFEQFLNDFSENVDVYEKQRAKAKNLIHTYQDVRSCERLVEISRIN